MLRSMPRLNLKNLCSIRCLAALAIVPSLMTHVPVWAQAAAPQPQLQRSTTPLIGFGLIFLMLVIVVSISLIPSKRSHQD